MFRSLLLCAAFTLMACSNQQRVGAETAVAKALVSDAQEAQIGAQVQAELAKQGVAYVSDPALVGYVQGVVNRLLPFAQRDRPGSYDLKVIDDPKTVNAFVTPGGHIYVYTGLLATAENEAELAGVLGHELGHVVARHASRQMVEAFGLQTVLGLALGKNPGLLSQLGAAVVGQGAMLANSRSDENEADEYGVKYSSEAGYDPHGIGTFFQKLMASQGRTPKILEFLSTHPASENRVAHVNALIAQGNYKGSDVGADRLAAIKPRIGPGTSVTAGGGAPPSTTGAPPSSTGFRAAPSGAPSRGAPPSGAPPSGAPPSSVPSGAPPSRVP